jgi:hypothetical protein
MRIAQAFLESDRAKIASAVQDSAGGFESVNSVLHTHYRAWLTDAAAALVEERRRTAGEGALATAAARSAHAKMLAEQGNPEQAVPMFREVLAARTEALAADDPATLDATANLALALSQAGQPKEAEALWRRVRDARAAGLGECHPDTLAAMGQLAAAMLALPDADLDDVEALHRETLDKTRATLCESHPDALIAAHNLAMLLMYHGGEYDEVEALFVDTLERARAVLGDAHPRTLTTMTALAELLLGDDADSECTDEGLEDAEKLCREALRAATETLGGAHPVTANARATLARVLRRDMRADEAARLVRAGAAAAAALRRRAHRTSVAVEGAATHRGEAPAEEKGDELAHRDTLASMCAALGDTQPESFAVALQHLRKLLSSAAGASNAILADAEEQLQLMQEEEDDDEDDDEDERFVLECRGAVLLELGAREADEHLQTLARELLDEAPSRLYDTHKVQCVLEHRRALYGEVHAHTLVALLRLADRLPKEEALALLQGAVQTFCAVLGDAHAHVQQLEAHSRRRLLRNPKGRYPKGGYR